MSHDLTAGTRHAVPVEAPPEADHAEAAAMVSRLWLYELLIAASAAFGAFLASVVGVLLYLR